MWSSVFEFGLCVRGDGERGGKEINVWVQRGVDGEGYPGRSGSNRNN